MDKNKYIEYKKRKRSDRKKKLDYLAENFNIRFLCNFYLFSVGGSGNSMYIMYTETKKENKHPLIRFELND